MSDDPERRASVCVFCGANPGTDPSYLQTARKLGRALAQEGLGVVYGGAAIGLMGALADGALAARGSVVGVVPVQLLDSDAHQGLTRVHVVSGMHERKAMMAQLSQAFVVLPGGLGTLDEMFEALTWTQLGFQTKPLVILDVGGYFDSLLAFLRLAHDRRFLLRPVVEVLDVETDVDAVLARLRQHRRTSEHRRCSSLDGSVNRGKGSL
jgi:uncharacterized protein (TIGR00730 family)